MKQNYLENCYFGKSFMMLGSSLDFCYDCKYCRVGCEKHKKIEYFTLPSEINPNFSNLPVAINLFYGDPLLQIDNTIALLKRLEKAKHKGPVIIVTKGHFSLFPDARFDLDLHIAFSTFGIDSTYDGSNMERFKENLEQTTKRKYNYHYSIEFRPICCGINDSEEIFENVLSLAKKFNMAVGYSGLQGKPESVGVWQKNGYKFVPYPGYSFGHKKLISDEKQKLFSDIAKKYNVPIFKKTSCLFSYVHNLERDYNAHYYRPNEVGCSGCVMEKKCMAYKSHQQNFVKPNVLPFEFDIIEKQNHECILKKKGICNFPTEDCSKISGKVLKTNVKLTTSDVRVIKWLTGFTVDADFEESPYISSFWLKKQ